MALPTTHGIGRLTGPIELRFAPSGTAVAKLQLAFNQRRKNQNGEWEDSEVCFLRATLFGDAAENAAETYGKGDEVLITGRLKTEQWTDRQSGENRQALALMVDGIGPSTRAVKAEIVKTNLRESSSGSWPEVSGPPEPAGASSTDGPPF